MKHLNCITTQLKIVAVIFLIFCTERNDILDRGQQLMLIFGYIGIVAFYTLWIFSILSMLIVAFMPNSFLKSLYIAMLFATTIVGVSYMKISGSPLMYDNLFSLIENTEFAENALSQYKKELFDAIIISSISFILFFPAHYRVKSFFSYSHIKKISYLIALFPVIIIFLLTLARGGYGVRATPMQYRIVSMLSTAGIQHIFTKENNREIVKFNPYTKADKMNIVLIVDESVRGDYLDINTNRGLTPYLFSSRKKIINFGFASSGANCSAQSNQILRFGPNVNKFNTTFRTNPYIWSYAKKAGYRTLMIEGQAKKGMLNNRMEKNELKEIDEFVYPNGLSSFDKDASIANIIASNIKRAEKNMGPVFIIAVKAGLHFPYNNIYPNNEEKFKISGEFSDKTNRINAYKNAIRYMMDNFFKIIFGITYNNTIVIYTSDHGQNLFDNGYNITHCSTVNVSPYEGIVPFFVITDNQYYKDKFIKSSSIKCNKISHFDIYPSILDIMGYNEKDYCEQHGYSLFSNIDHDRKFTSALLSVSINRVNDDIVWNYLPDTLQSDGCSGRP